MNQVLEEWAENHCSEWWRLYPDRWPSCCAEGGSGDTAAVFVSVSGWNDTRVWHSVVSLQSLASIMFAGQQDASIIRIPPHHYIHVLDQNTNIARVEIGPLTYIRQDNERSEVTCPPSPHGAASFESVLQEVFSLTGRTDPWCNPITGQFTDQENLVLQQINSSIFYFEIFSLLYWRFRL